MQDLIWHWMSCGRTWMDNFFKPSLHPLIRQLEPWQTGTKTLNPCITIKIMKILMKWNDYEAFGVFFIFLLRWNFIQLQMSFCIYMYYILLYERMLNTKELMQRQCGTDTSTMHGGQSWTHGNERRDQVTGGGGVNVYWLATNVSWMPATQNTYVITESLQEENVHVIGSMWFF